MTFYMALPSHPLRYTQGPSTPRPLRMNDVLWADLRTIARRHGINTTLLMRCVLEQFADDNINRESADHLSTDMHGEDHA